MLKNARTLVLLCVLAVFASKTRAATVTVSMSNFAFTPKNVTINVGDTVTWVAATSGHDTTSNTGLWASGTLPQGGSFSFKFNSPGTFNYRCIPHASFGMTGTVTVQGAANQPPTVSLTAPGNGATFSTTDTITFSANATDDVGVAKVEFFSDGTLIGQADTTAPYSVTGSLAAGTHSITAKATDTGGLSTTTSPITITVNAPQNQPPTISLTAPTGGATFLTTDTITFSANASDDAGVAKVEFFSDGSLIGAADTTAPYSVSASLPAGTHSITATATDTGGLSTSTQPITITVGGPNQPPTAALASAQAGKTIAAPGTVSLTVTATDDGSIVQVEFFQNATSVGVDTSAPYEATISNLAPGLYTFTATAKDNGGLTGNSNPIDVRVAAEPHIDSITQDGSVITIVATATSGISYDLEGTTDFLDWTKVDTATASNGSVTLHDTVNQAFRFYRIVAR